MKKYSYLLIVALVMTSAGLMAPNCSEDGENPLGVDFREICGPCGQVKNGDATISGVGSVDGFFKAVGSLNISFGAIRADFEAHVRKLALAFEVEGAADADFEDLIEDTVKAIKAELNGSIEGGIEGGLKVNYVPPKCEVNVQASFEAQAQCEAKAGCDVELECSGGDLSFECKGECHGSCDGECDFPMCTVELEASLECSGECNGKCVAPSASAECEGTCRGECDGNCSAYVENTSGGMDCAGACEGECNGECAIEVSGGECEASCEGECKVEASADVECEGEVECHGECDGSCSGGCEGKIKAPKCEGAAECEASADCQAQASASASANASCTPPTLDLQYNLKASIAGDAAAKAKFIGKLTAFKVEMVGILKGMANLKILFDADAAAEIGIDPPAVTLKASFEGLIDDIDGEFAAPGLIPCAFDAFDDAVSILKDLPGDMEATVSGQVEFYGILF